MASAQEITRAMGGNWHGRYGLIPSPGHSPKDRGTKVSDAPDRPDGVLFQSYNGGDFKETKDECRRRGLIEEWQPQGDAWRQTGCYEFVAADGTVAYRTVRKEKLGEAKRFVAQRPDGRGGWANGLVDVERVPYRLPEILAAESGSIVYLVEGERKADKLASWGLVATAVAFGAKGWRRDYARALAGHSIVILPDNDEPGREFAQRASADIIAAGGNARIIELPGLPPKGDVIDWTGTAEDLRALVDTAVNPPARMLATINPAAWDGREAPTREWYLEDWIPARQATLLTGKGGVGKSLLAQQLATCVAMGLPFLGLETRRANALYLSCEDDAEELWRRQGAICASLGITLRDLDGKLLLAPMAGEMGNHLATFDQSGKMLPSERWREIEATVAAASIGFFALDNASHLMVGDHNDLSMVAAFLNLLNALAIASNGAGLILHHPNKAGDDWLGSVAWENQVRSRLIMKPSDQEGDLDARSLQNPKANYAPMGGRVDFRWHRGSFITAEDLPANVADEMAANSRAAGDNAIFLACLAERTRQARAISERRSASYAPTEFVKMSESKGASKARLEAAMDRLFRLGRIERAELWRGPDRKPVFGLRETVGDAPRDTRNTAEIGAGDTVRDTVRGTRDTVSETAEMRAGDADNTHSTPKGVSAAAAGGAAASPNLNGSRIDLSRVVFPADDDSDPAADAYLSGR